MASWRESDYRAFAEIHAHVEMEDKNYIFAVNIGHYDTIDDYNQNKLRKRQVNEIYDEGEGNNWRWDSTENRIYYDTMRIESVTYDKYAQFAIGGLILHRIISLIDVVYLERKVSVNPSFSSKSAELKLTFSLD